jgi:AGZA family xanthine/uracil permease-like MFS transporter
MDRSIFWKKGDWAGFFGLFINNLTNLLAVIGLLIGVVGFPKEVVFGRIIPAFGLAVFCASAFYTWFAVQMMRESGRKDVTALPSGPSAPSIFTVTFLVILPVFKTTNSYEFALEVGLVWCFIEATILTAGSFLGDAIRRIIPRTVLLSCLSGLGLLLLAMNPMLQSFEAPTAAFVVMVLIFINWFGKKPLLPQIPTGFLLLLVGTVLAWISGLQSPEAVTASLHSLGFYPPSLHITSFLEGLPKALPYLASAIPLGLANYVFDLENIESAHAAGDPYPTRKVMLANGISSFIGCFMGNPFPVTVYIGHAGWKTMGAQIGYTMATGTTMLIVSLFGLGALLAAIVPMVVVAPILIFVGIVTANQVVRESARDEVPVIFVCLFPWIANWASGVVANAVKASGKVIGMADGQVSAQMLAKNGIIFQGLSNLGNGAPLVSLIWGCITIFAIKDRPLAGAFSAAFAAALTAFGIIHSPVVGIWLPPMVPLVIGYGMIAAVFVFKHLMNERDARNAIPAVVEAEPQAAAKTA